MAVTFDLPPDLEHHLRAQVRDIDYEAKRAYAVELYRQGRISSGLLANMLGLSRDQADALLKVAGIAAEATIEQVMEDSDALRSLRERDAGRR